MAGARRPDDTIRLAPLADGGEGTLDAIEAAGGWTGARLRHRSDRTTDRGTWLEREVAGAARRGRRRAGHGVRPVAAPARRARSTRGDHPRHRRAHPRRGRRRGATRSRSASAAAPRRRRAGIVEALGGRVGADGSLDLPPSTPTGRGRSPCRMRRSNPLLGPTRRGRHVRPAEGRVPGRGPRTRRAPRRPGPTSSSGDRPSRARHARRRRSRRRRLRPARNPGPIPSFALHPGIELVMAATGFDAALADADLVITGEGRIDAQTAFGKTALGVAPTRAGGGHPLDRRRRRRDARGHRGACGRRERSSSRSSSGRCPSTRRWPPGAPPIERAASALARGPGRHAAGPIGP